MNKKLYALTLIFISFKVFAVDVNNEFENEKIWNKYCIGDRKSSNIPRPNYKDSDVYAAVKKLTMISPYSFYFYSGPLYAYDLKKGKELVEPPADFPNVPEVKMGKKNAHAFMTVLCGEFRDRPTLIKDKVRWVNRMYTLPDAPQKTINTNHELWSQVSAHSYSKYISNTRAIFSAKDQYLKANNYRANIGQYSEDYPVEPFSVCETKFIFKRFVETNAQFSARNDGLKQYKKEYNKFKDRCLKDDLEYFYDFRGDSNFKPNSPESNGMIWYSSTITNSCVRVNGKYVLKTAAKTKFDDPEICEKYFKNPFAYRWSAARAGLASWLMHDKKYDEIFSNAKKNVTITPHLTPSEKPFGFKMPVSDRDFYVEELDKNEKGEYYTWDMQKGGEVILTQEQADIKLKEIADLKAAFEQKKADSNTVLFDFMTEWNASKEEFWKRSDIGFNSVVGFDSRTPNTELAFERLRNAVNRHTDWYASAYDDGSGTVRDQAYSPFVASSYEMSASDTFTAPGTTVNSPADGCKHWMFVFKLKKDQWYNTLSILSKTPVDFNRNWFDETSLGTNGLANSERALDRLGTALEGEMDSIIYLHNLTTHGTVNAKCGAEQMGLAPPPEPEPVQPAVESEVDQSIQPKILQPPVHTTNEVPPPHPMGMPAPMPPPHPMGMPAPIPSEKSSGDATDADMEMINNLPAPGTPWPKESEDKD